MDGTKGRAPRSGDAKTVRVLIVDDHPMVREGLVSLLSASGDIEVIATARDGAEAVELAARSTPDVVLMDLAMPNVGGAEATERLASLDRGIRVVVLTAFGDRSLLHRALAAGAHGYLLKDAGPDELRAAVRAAAQDCGPVGRLS